MKPLRSIPPFICVLSVLIAADAHGAVPSVALEEVAAGLTAPNLAIHAGDGSGRLFIVDQIGHIRLVTAAGVLQATPFLNISAALVPLGAFGPGTFDERGLLGLAFHPDFANNKKFYVYYSAPKAPDLTINFEEPALPKGVDSFDFAGIHFDGGIAGTQAILPLYSSIPNAYEVASGASATITFPAPVTRVRFFFVHRLGATPGTATALDAADNPVAGPVESNLQTVFNDPANFVTLEEPTSGISKIRLDAGTGAGLVLFLDDLQIFNSEHVGRVSEFLVSNLSPNLANPFSQRVLLEINEPQFNHNSGMLAFGPDDGYLYVTVGDGGAANDVALGHNPAIGNGQDNETLLGKLLRIDVDGGPPFAIPPDNPFVGLPGRDEIYATGLRNAFRFSFDVGADHRLFLADVGQDLFEEVNIVNKGDNLGWNIREGFHCFDPDNPSTPPANCPAVDAGGNPLVDPILEYPHSGPAGTPVGIAVIGGYVQRNMAFAGLYGTYVFSDFSTNFGAPDGSLFVANEVGGIWNLHEPIIIGGDAQGRLGRFALGMGQDADGDVYVCTSENLAPVGNTGKVFKIIPPPGDLDGDGDVDPFDFLTFSNCFNGSLNPPLPGCANSEADIDSDSDVDAFDFLTFSNCFNGALNPAGCL